MSHVKKSSHIEWVMSYMCMSLPLSSYVNASWQRERVMSPVPFIANRMSHVSLMLANRISHVSRMLGNWISHVSRMLKCVMQELAAIKAFANVICEWGKANRLRHVSQVQQCAATNATTNVICGWGTTCMNESWHIATVMSHICKSALLSNMKKSWQIRMKHVTYEWVIAHRMSHVSHIKWVMSVVELQMSSCSITSEWNCIHNFRVSSNSAVKLKDVQFNVHS